MRHLAVRLSVFFSLVISAPVAWAAGEGSQSLTVDGVLFSSTNFTGALLDPSVKFKVQILDPTKTCVLYEETQFKETVSTKGHYNLKIGSPTGNAKRTGDDPNHAMIDILQNVTAITATNATCGGGTYNPSSGDNRFLRIVVTPSSTGVAETLSPDLALTSVTNALVCESVQGLDRSKLLEIGTSVHANMTQANFQALINGSDASALHHHDSRYVRLSSSDSMSMGSQQTIGLGQFTNVEQAAMTASLNTSTDVGKTWVNTSTGRAMYWNGTTAVDLSAGGSADNLGNHTATGALNMSSNLINNVTDPASPQDAATKNYVDGQTSGISSTYVAVAGDTMTGNLTMNATSSVRFADTDSSNYVGFRAPGTVGSDLTWTLPAADGTTGQFLTTNGAGILSWGTAGTGDFLADGTVAMTGNLQLGTNAINNDGGAGEGLTFDTSGNATFAQNVTVTGNVTATAFVGNGAGLTGITGATGGVSNTVNTNIVSDSDSNGSGVTTFTVGATTAMTIDNSGNVGIGTVTPGTSLEVAGQVKITGGSPGNGKVLVSDAVGLASWQTLAGMGDLVSTNNLADLTSASLARTNLGLVIGTDVQAFDADLTDLADGTLSASKVENGTFFIDSSGSNGQVWTSDGAGAGYWSAAASGDVSATRDLTAGAGLTGGGDLSADRTFDVGAGTGILVAADTVSVDVGLTAGKIVQLDGSARLPAVDGSQLTGVVATDTSKLLKAGDTMIGDLVMGLQTDVRYADADSSNYAAIQAPTTIATNYTLTLPVDDGTSGQILSTDGSGVLSWISAGGSGDFLANGTVAMTGNLNFNSNKGVNVATPTAAGDAVNKGYADANLRGSALGAPVANQSIRWNAGGTAWEYYTPSSGDVSSATDMIAGAGLTGGGTLAANRTFNVGAGAGIIVAADTIAVDVGTTAAKIVQLDGSARLPAVDGSQLTGVVAADATKVPLAGGTMTGNLIMNARNDVRFADVDSSNYAAIQAPATIATDYTLTLPVDDGTAGQVLRTDGFGNLSWVALAGGGDFLADGTVAMTGNMRLGTNGLSNDGGIGKGLTFDTPGNATFAQNVSVSGNIILGANRISNDGGAGDGLTFDTTGNATFGQNVTAPAYFYTSDRRLKTNFRDVKGLETILNLHGVHFDWKKDGSPEVGLIAQEVEEILPELVSTDPETGMKAVKYGNIVAPLIESVKDLHSLNMSLNKKVSSQERRIAGLEEKNKELENRLKAMEAKLKKLLSK